MSMALIEADDWNNIAVVKAFIEKMKSLSYESGTRIVC